MRDGPSFAWRFDRVLVAFFAVLLPAAPAAGQSLELLHLSRQLGHLEAHIERLRQRPDATAEAARLKDELRTVDIAVRALATADAASAALTTAATQAARTAPREAWWAVESVGIMFAIAWAIVAVQRERTRRREIDVAHTPDAQALARLKLLLGADAKALGVLGALDARIKALEDLLKRP